MVPDISFFTKIPNFPDPALFPDHHSLSLCPKVPTKRASLPFYLTSGMQHTSTLLFLSSSHTSVFLLQRLPTFNVPNVMPLHSGLNPEILCTPAHLRAAGDWKAFHFFLSWKFVRAKFFYREHATAYPQPQFSDVSNPTKQISWQPHD